MKITGDQVKNWFGYSRRERTGSFILLIIIFLVLLVRSAIPEKIIEIEDITFITSDPGNSLKLEDTPGPADVQLFFFDPNHVSYDSLILLGLTGKEAGTLINYRNKGGFFTKPSDIKKIYGLGEGKSDRLIPFIVFKPFQIKKTEVVLIRKEESLIEVNSCDSALLVSLPGIGPVLSVRIIKYRNLLGGFAVTDQLKEVYGLNEETYELIKGRLFADTALLKRIHINLADYKELARMPYFERFEVSAILKYRELQGRIEAIEDLVLNKILTPEKAEKVSPYLYFD